MNISTHKSSMLRPLEWLAALIGAINCILVPGLFAQQGRSFPLPFLYFLEIILLGVLVLLFVARRPQLDDRWHALPWAAAGVILAFVILGGFSIGFFSDSRAHRFYCCRGSRRSAGRWSNIATYEPVPCGGGDSGSGDDVGGTDRLI